MKLSNHNTNWYKKYYDSCCLLGYRGSIAHGTYRSTDNPNSIDDKDILGVLIYPKEYYLGLDAYHSKHQTRESFEGEWDCVFYELRHFIALLVKANPNVLSTLWMNDNLFIKRTEIGQMLIDNRDLFATKKAYYAFTGYAYSQLKRMMMVGSKYQGHMGAKRKALVEKFGYDTKNASHLVRLLKMGIEFMTTGELQVMREDSAYLLDIKDGKYSIAEIRNEADRLFRLSEEAYVRSKLPPKVDEDKVNDLLVKMLETTISCQPKETT